jgi:hypothetical protein
MHSVIVDFALDSGWASEVRDFGEEAVDRCATTDVLNAREQRVGSLGWYGPLDSVQKSVFPIVAEGRNVTKSIPMMGCVKAAPHAT